MWQRPQLRGAGNLLGLALQELGRAQGRREPGRVLPMGRGRGRVPLPPAPVPAGSDGMAASRLFAFITWALRWVRRGCLGTLCSHRVTEGSVRGHLPTVPTPGTLLGLGLRWGIALGQEQGSSPLCPSLALGGHGEANAMSRSVQHVETINNLT